MSAELVDADWLAAHLDEVVVADVRWSPTESTAGAERAFVDGHLPGAIFFDLDRDLAGRPFVDGPGRHPLPSAEAFAAVLRAAGIRDDDSVVAYDDVRGSVAARLWWMLDATGRRAALLDGGLQAWTGALETGPAPARAATEVETRKWPAERIATADDVAQAVDVGGAVLDARAEERFRGEVETIDPVAGHIPGARSAAWAGNLDDRGGLRSPEELRERYRSVGVDGAGEAIAYCGSGVTSCLDVFAMRLAGMGTAKLYVGSWSGWIHDRDRPIATGDVR
jgi:thiosulfate/3-mercaptopyruvate sulfurtransferase